MRIWKSYTLIVFILGFFLVSGCQMFVNREREKMQMIGPNLINLTKKVEVKVLLEDATLDKGERKLLEESTRNKPSLLEWFDENDYLVKANIIDQHAILLVCTSDGKRGLYEDTDCKTGPDKQLWKSKESSCEFTIDKSYIQQYCQ